MVLKRCDQGCGDALPTRLIGHEHIGDLVPGKGEPFGVDEAPLPFASPEGRTHQLRPKWSAARVRISAGSIAGRAATELIRELLD